MSSPSVESATEKNGARATYPEEETGEHSETESAGTDGSEELRGGKECMDASEVIEILSNERRRLLWRYLRQESSEGELSDVSRQIAAWENGTAVDDVSYDERKSVYTSLHQFHCPKMEEAGLIEFDKRDSVVRVVSEEPEAFVVEVEPDVRDALSTRRASHAVATRINKGSWALGLPVFGDLTLAAVLLSTGIGAIPAVFVYSILVQTSYNITLPDVLSRLDS